MTREEKQILEMAKIISDTWLVNLDGDTFNVSEFLDEVDIESIATELNEHGYRKITENEVVISKEEKQKLLKEMYEQGKFDAIADLDKDYKVIISKGTLERLFTEEEVAKLKEYARKETAEKILTSIKELLKNEEPSYTIELDIIYKLLQDFAKQFGVDLGG